MIRSVNVLVLILLVTLNSFAWEYVQGYIKTNEGDSVSCEVSIPEFYPKDDHAPFFYDQVYTKVDGKKKKLQADEISCFGFVLGKTHFRYASYQIDNGDFAEIHQLANNTKRPRGFFQGGKNSRSNCT